MRVSLGDLLVNEDLITRRQLHAAITHQRTHGGELGGALVHLGILRDDDITALLSRTYRVPSINLSRFDIDDSVIKLIPPATARKYQVVPLSCTGVTLTIAMTDPTNVFAMDDIKFMTGYNVEPVVASDAALASAITRYYTNGDPGAEVGPSALEIATRELDDMPHFHDEHVEVLDETEEVDTVNLQRQGGEGPVVRLVNVLLASAIHKGASDVHVESYETEFRIRFRIDGMLYTVMTPPLKMREAVISRLKIMAKLNIAEKRLPQDGRIKMRFRDQGATREIDLRVSSLPTLFGEKVVLRLLDRDRLTLDMAKLGFEAPSLERFEASIRSPWGMVLVTGPTGSGKTNTLYSSISRLNAADTNIMTAEDPVEFNLTGVNQVQIRESIGLTFATALRSFLRQDPNVILVGEIRDVETAEVAVKAALTGHLVLSTLHTNDAPSSVARLLNMGIEPFLVASSLNLVCAQRLVRCVCRRCAEPSPMPSEALVEIGFSPSEAASLVPTVGHGCSECNNTGYKGRVGLFEAMPISPSLQEAILSGASSLELRRRALDEGMITLRQSGLRKIADGMTTVEEVVRETGR